MILPLLLPNGNGVTGVKGLPGLFHGSWGIQTQFLTLEQLVC